VSGYSCKVSPAIFCKASSIALSSSEEEDLLDCVGWRSRSIFSRLARDTRFTGSFAEYYKNPLPQESLAINVD
jgi:hypothetical protein